MSATPNLPVFGLALDVSTCMCIAEHLAARMALPVVRFDDVAEPDGWLDTKQAAEYVSLTVAALHRHTAARTIPFEQDAPGGKCWFKRSELDAWRRGERVT
jgi:excisionase family DNA binding protein